MEKPSSLNTENKTLNTENKKDLTESNTKEKELESVQNIDQTDQGEKIEEEDQKKTKIKNINLDISNIELNKIDDIEFIEFIANLKKIVETTGGDNKDRPKAIHDFDAKDAYERYKSCVKDYRDILKAIKNGFFDDVLDLPEPIKFDKDPQFKDRIQLLRQRYTQELFSEIILSPKSKERLEKIVEKMIFSKKVKELKDLKKKADKGGVLSVIDYHNFILEDIEPVKTSEAEKKEFVTNMLKKALCAIVKDEYSDRTYEVFCKTIFSEKDYEKFSNPLKHSERSIHDLFSFVYSLFIKNKALPDYTVFEKRKITPDVKEKIIKNLNEMILAIQNELIPGIKENETEQKKEDSRILEVNKSAKNIIEGVDTILKKQRYMLKMSKDDNLGISEINEHAKQIIEKHEKTTEYIDSYKKEISDDEIRHYYGLGLIFEKKYKKKDVKNEDILDELIKTMETLINKVDKGNEIEDLTNYIRLNDEVISFYNELRKKNKSKDTKDNKDNGGLNSAIIIENLGQILKLCTLTYHKTGLGKLLDMFKKDIDLISNDKNSKLSDIDKEILNKYLEKIKGIEPAKKTQITQPQSQTSPTSSSLEFSENKENLSNIQNSIISCISEAKNIKDLNKAIHDMWNIKRILNEYDEENLQHIQTIDISELYNNNLYSKHLKEKDLISKIQNKEFFSKIRILYNEKYQEFYTQKKFFNKIFDKIFSNESNIMN